MIIAVLSGKGGTGKTLVSVNLAEVAENSYYLDCDVEEPNGHLFFKPEIIKEEAVNVKIPVIDHNLCNGCKECVEFCNFNALAFARKVILFETICHSCGGCKLVCPTKAISERDKKIGIVQYGKSLDTIVNTGFLNPGEVSGVPIIGELLKTIPTNAYAIIDCPPGSACVVMDSIKDADYVVLVAEPTIFGSHNLNMVFELVKVFNKPFGVVLNKCLPSLNPSEELCKDKNMPILMKIDFDKELGKLNSNGKIVARESEKYRQMFSTLLDKIKEATL